MKEGRERPRRAPQGVHGAVNGMGLDAGILRFRQRRDTLVLREQTALNHIGLDHGDVLSLQQVGEGEHGV